jgi:UDP-glucose 4-epimerase
VGDVVAAMLAAAGSQATGPVNIGTGVETDVLELVSALSELGDGADFEPEFAPPRTGEVARISIDPARATSELGWTPQMGLKEGLRVTLDSI